MAERILISTQDLEPAVRLRDAFVDDDFDVELLTPGERVADSPDAVLLILTGALGEKPARRLAREAAEAERLPVIGLLDPDVPAAALRAQLGLADAFVKPIDVEEVVRSGRRLIDRRRLRAVTGIIGETDAMIEVLERVVQIAPVNSTVLVTGESGTGKERVARGLHALSQRRHRPFIAANVAALPETLLESELFGHEKGSFTGAIGQRKGFFELAHRGTLFLDEIGEMPLATQTKLLRVLEEREFMRVGGEAPIQVDVRVIAATNQHLSQLVEAGRFRRDLYYRVNVLHIHLPPLRERKADIPLLVDHFIRQTAEEHDRSHVAISPEAMRILIDYPWPGNVREIRNLIESMVVLSAGTIVRPEDIPPEIRDGTSGRRLLPVPLPRLDDTREGTTPPELEFIFRTLLQLRMDVEDLRHHFADFRDSHPELHAPAYPALGQPLATTDAYIGPARHIEDIETADDENERAKEHEVVVFRPGMTLHQLEEQAIIAALKEVSGNRRKAAEMLGMGERTLYRKIKEYNIPL